MKKHWLRGMLLGVSLALLLAGGVALAQALTLTVDQDCFECWPGALTGPDEEHVLVVTLDDYAYADLYIDLYINGKLYGIGNLPGEDLSSPPCEIRLWVDCGQLGLHIDDTCEVANGATAGLLDAGVANGPVEYGDWVFRAWQDQEEPVEVAFTFAEVCEAPVEFVPEPGTIALLGSGLAGLAGYAALRWRARN